jgi:hypothetical protein
MHDGRTVATLKSPDPRALQELTDWVLTSQDPKAVAMRAELSKRDISGFTPPDVLEILPIAK